MPHPSRKPIRKHSRRLFTELLERRLLLTAVAGFNPTPNTNLAPVSTDIVATFDQAIDSATATAQTFVVDRERSGHLGGGDTTITVDGTNVTSDPAVDFFPGERVRVVATESIQSTGGEANTPRVWEFRTAVTVGSGQFVQNGQTLGNHNTHGMAMGDLDGDGDLDILQGNYNSENQGDANRVWLNDGDGNFTDSGQLLGNHNARDVALGDLDGDGDLDYISANYPTMPNRVFLNDGSGGFADSGQLIGNANSWDVELGDVDGDGDLDAYVGNGYAPNRLYLNDGSGQFTDSGQDMGPGSSQALKLGDLDGDGDVDAFVTNFGSGNRIWLNDGTGIFIDTGQSLGTGLDVEVRLGDMDGDGDLDAVDSNRLWLNDGDGVFSDSNQNLGAGNNRVGIGDVDGDGDLDIFYNQNDVFVLLNNGVGTFADSGQSLSTNASDCGLELGDLDADGDLDVYVGHCSQPDVVWINQNLEPSVTLSIDEAAIGEDGEATVTAALSEAHTQAVTVTLGFSGTATEGEDYTASASEITIPIGSTTGSITINSVQDTVDEPDETVIVDITDATGASEAGTQQVTTTIQDDDEPVMPDVAISLDNTQIPEAEGVATVGVTLSEATTLPVTVTLGFGGTATAGDFVASAAEVVMAAGATSGSITIMAVQDEVNEPDETVIVEIVDVVGGNEDGVQEQTVTIVDDDVPPTFTVTSITSGASTIHLEFANPLDTSEINLYDTQNSGMGPSDVVVTGATSGTVVGSLITHESSITFIKSGEPFVSDTYTVTLRSAENGFKDDTGALLDGDGDGNAGDDYVSQFTIDPAPDGARTIHLGDFVRGPGQAVNLPADAAGIPLVLSDGDGVRAVDVRINYDPALLEITNATAPAGGSVVLNTATPGIAILVYFNSSALPAGEVEFINLEATVPSENGSANYGRQQILDLSDVIVGDGDDNEFPVIVDDALQLASFFADVSGNGRINAADAAQVARNAALIDSGFIASLLTDPLIVGDISGNGRLNAGDASLVARSAALIPVDEIPPIPPGGLTAGVFVPVVTPSQTPRETETSGDALAGQVATFRLVERFVSQETLADIGNVDAFFAEESDGLSVVDDLRTAIDELFE